MSQAQTLIMKFGGTSVGSPKAMARALEIVGRGHTEWPRLVVVTSAMSGVTNLLLDSAAQAAGGAAAVGMQAALRLQKLHDDVAEALISNPTQRAALRQELDGLISEFSNLCHAIYVLGEASPRALDAVASLGERLSVRLLAACLQSAGLDAVYVEASLLIETNERYQNAHPDFAASRIKTRAVLNPLLDSGKIPVVTGFIGATPAGVITTLGRGGSDYTAGILGALLPAADVWIWTDVDGVMSADPRLVPSAHTIPEVTYREIAELAYFGAKVLHPKTIRPLVDAGIGLRICNTFNPAHPGTRLIADPQPTAGAGEKRPSAHQIIKAVTAIHGQRLVTVEGRGMLGVPGVAARTFGAVAAAGVSVTLITQASSEQSICFSVPSEAANAIVESLKKTFASELADLDIDRIWANGEAGIITVVGLGMIHTPGVAGRIFSALGEQGVNVIAIAQGSSEVSISLVVAAADSEAAVQALHHLTQ